ncbi:alanine:cation symporter family protein [Roseospira navarrensis]|uniref:Uncharacterized protein n=1 Tax=Roseospira navarrensis TaxID=140058 RepID=A0A7X1ZGI7_9PROT|nr:alanine:cation symporter family protein [Roseospira navarrensis]MQX37201.1 hypothetical protein [Roseospira navarrensis]
MEFIEGIFGRISDLTWGWSLIPFLVVLGVFFTLISKLVQFQFFGRMFRVLYKPETGVGPNRVSSREALLVSVGGRVGGGNIAGVAVAITLGENALTVFTESRMMRHVMRLAIVGVVFLGATAPGATAVFFFSDPLMGVLALVNLVALTMLFPVGMRLLKDYRHQLAEGREHPVFNPDDFADLDIDRTAWTPSR